MSLLSRIVNAFRGDRLSRELDEEFSGHIEDAIRQGRDSSEARRAFGSPLRQREASRDIRVVAWIDSLCADAVFGWRQLNKHKATSVAAILSLGLAVGACTSVFGIIDALFLRPLPIANPERLYGISLPGLTELHVHPIPSDAWVGEGGPQGSNGADCDLRGSVLGFDLRTGNGSGQRESQRSVRLRMDVRLLRTPSRSGPAAHGIRRHEARRESRRGSLLRLLDPPLCARSQRHREHGSHGTGLAHWPEQQDFRDRGRRTRALHRHRAGRGD